MDGMEHLKSVIIIAATNRPDIIDQALLRPGRFDHLVYIPPPNLDARTEIFRINIVKGKMPVEKSIKIEDLAAKTEVHHHSNHFPGLHRRRNLPRLPRGRPQCPRPLPPGRISPIRRLRESHEKGAAEAH
jgi:hypothetical protein